MRALGWSLVLVLAGAGACDGREAIELSPDAAVSPEADGGVDTESDVAPVVAATSPADGAAEVEPTMTIEARFSEPMDPATIDAATFVVTADGAPVRGVISYDAETATARFVPEVPLALRGRIVATVRKGAADAEGAPLARERTWAFDVRDGAWHPGQAIEASDGAVQCAEVALDAGGSATVVWRQASGDDHKIWANRRTRAEAWGAPVALSPTGHDVGCPQLAVDGMGAVTAVWVQDPGNLSDVWTRRFTPTEGWSEARMIAGGPGEVRSPDVATTASGDAMVVWSEVDGRKHETRASYRAAGTWGAPFIVGVDQDGADDDYQPRVIAASDAFVVMWTQSMATQHPSLWSRRFDGEWGPATHVADGWAQAIDLGVDAAGRVTAVWTRPGEVADTRTARLAEAGWSTPVAVDTTDGLAAWTRVAVAPSGHAVAVWVQNAGGASDKPTIWARRFDPDLAWQAPVQLSDGTAGAHKPQVVIDGAGNALAVWLEREGSRETLRASRQGADGGWFGPASVDAHDTFLLLPRLAIDPSGRATVVWLRQDPDFVGLDRARVWAARFQ